MSLMKVLTAISILIFVTTGSFAQSMDSSGSKFVEKIVTGHPLLIQYDHGGCFVSHQQQIVIEAITTDSLTVTIKRYLPIAFRHYKYINAKKKYQPQDSIKIADPFTFKFPLMGERDYCTVASDYLYETSFNVSRVGIAKFMNEFILLADNGKLEPDINEIEGLYSTIKLTQDALSKEYSIDGWYFLDLRIKKQR